MRSGLRRSVTNTMSLEVSRSFCPGVILSKGLQSKEQAISCHNVNLLGTDHLFLFGALLFPFLSQCHASFHRHPASSLRQGVMYEIRLRQYTSTADTSTADTSTTGTGSQGERWTKSTSIHRGAKRTPRYQIYEYRSISTTRIWCNIHDWSSTTTRIAVTTE